MGAKDLPPEWKAAEPVSREDRDALFREGGEGDRGKRGGGREDRKAKKARERELAKTRAEKISKKGEPEVKQPARAPRAFTAPLKAPRTLTKAEIDFELAQRKQAAEESKPVVPESEPRPDMAPENVGLGFELVASASTPGELESIVARYFDLIPDERKAEFDTAVRAQARELKEELERKRQDVGGRLDILALEVAKIETPLTSRAHQIIEKLKELRRIGGAPDIDSQLFAGELLNTAGTSLGAAVLAGLLNDLATETDPEMFKGILTDGEYYVTSKRELLKEADKILLKLDKDIEEQREKKEEKTPDETEVLRALLSEKTKILKNSSDKVALMMAEIGQKRRELIGRGYLFTADENKNIGEAAAHLKRWQTINLKDRRPGAIKTEKEHLQGVLNQVESYIVAIGRDIENVEKEWLPWLENKLAEYGKTKVEPDKIEVEPKELDKLRESVRQELLALKGLSDRAETNYLAIYKHMREIKGKVRSTHREELRQIRSCLRDLRHFATKDYTAYVEDGDKEALEALLQKYKAEISTAQSVVENAEARWIPWFEQRTESLRTNESNSVPSNQAARETRQAARTISRIEKSAKERKDEEKFNAALGILANEYRQADLKHVVRAYCELAKLYGETTKDDAVVASYRQAWKMCAEQAATLGVSSKEFAGLVTDAERLKDKDFAKTAELVVASYERSKTPRKKREETPKEAADKQVTEVPVLSPREGETREVSEIAPLVFAPVGDEEFRVWAAAMAKAGYTLTLGAKGEIVQQHTEGEIKAKYSRSGDQLKIEVISAPHGGTGVDSTFAQDFRNITLLCFRPGANQLSQESTITAPQGKKAWFGSRVKKRVKSWIKSWFGGWFGWPQQSSESH